MNERLPAVLNPSRLPPSRLVPNRRRLDTVCRTKRARGEQMIQRRNTHTTKYGFWQLTSNKKLDSYNNLSRVISIFVENKTSRVNCWSSPIM